MCIWGFFTIQHYLLYHSKKTLWGINYACDCKGNLFPAAENRENTHWLKSIDSIISDVSSGRLVRNRIWLGGCSTLTLLSRLGWPNPGTTGLLASLFFFFLLSSEVLGSLGLLGLSWNVPFILEITSLSVFEYWILWKNRINLSNNRKL